MFQFGLRAHDLGRLPAEQLAQALAQFQPSSIQLALSKALSDPGGGNGTLSPGYARRLRHIFESRNIAIAVLGCYINPVHPDPDKRNQELLRFEEHLRFARDFGCAIVGTETGHRSADGSFHPDTNKPETFDLLCRSLERLLRTAEACSALIGVEAVAGKHTISSIEKMATLLHRLDSPNLQVIYDPVNLIPQEGLTETQESFFARAMASFGSRIVAVHAKDFRMEAGQKIGTLPAGTGELNYPTLFRLLSQQKPWVDVLLEDCSPTSAGAALAFVRSLTAQTDNADKTPHPR
jgi:sugar phosphate isomerase/epimerase